MTAHFDLVILIDCWEPSDVWIEEEQHKEIHEFYERIVNRLGEYDFKNVVLASYPRPNDNSRETARWLVDNIHSRNHGTDLKLKQCENIVQVFREYPEALHTGTNTKNKPNAFNILICGQAWQVCTHWRPLGFINWIMQWQTVFTHPDVVWHTGQPAFDHFVLEEDPRIEWHATEPNTFASWSLGTSDTIIESPCFYANKLKWDLPNEVPPSTLYHRRET
jgi:hypothetical protein|tara:strand:+ start:909 stop:1568 length:660 start_codon:yes stop_codon:yes gene_type:complete